MADDITREPWFQRMRRALEAKLKAEADDVYLWDEGESGVLLSGGFFMFACGFTIFGLMECYDFLYNAISVGKFAVGDFFSALALFLSAALVFALIFSPWVRLSTDGFPSIQPRKEGSIPSMDALELLRVTNVVSLIARYIRWLRSSCRMKVVEGDPVDRPEPTPDETLFLLSCKSGDVDTVRALIEAGVNPNAKSKRGTTGLMLAARMHFFDVMVELMQAGATPAAQSADGTTALILACSRDAREHETDLRCVNMLLKKLTYDDINMAKQNGVTALMVAAYFAMGGYVYELLTHGAEMTLESVDNVGALTLVDPKTRPYKFSAKARISQQLIYELLLEAQTQPLSLLREATEGDIQLSSGDYVQILYDDELGHGSFGTVYEGRMRGMRVAVKQLLVQDSRNYQRELGALSALGNSERVVKFYGSVRNGNIAYIVMEYCSFSLFGYLHNSSDDPLDAELILRWMSQLAEGIQFLHANDLVHRDIKTQNVLVENDQIKIADFGLAKAFRRADSAASMTNYAYAQGTFEYMAPELFDPPSFGLSRGSEYTHKSDVYAFGVVLWECATREKPYAEVGHVLALAQMVPEGERPRGELRTELPGDYAELVSQCWHQERSERPSTDEIVERLDVMYNEL